MKLSEIAELVGGCLPDGAGEIEISGVAALRDALPGDISFLTNMKYADQVATTKASAVLVGEAYQAEVIGAVLLRVKSPDKAFSDVVPLFSPPPVVYTPGVHPTAVVGLHVTLGDGVHVGAYAVIGDNSVIGARAIIDAHVVVGERCVIGDDAHLYPMSSVRERCRLGRRVILHNGVVIGADGFGYTTDVRPDGSVNVEKIPQMGIVELCDDVEVGANTTIDRARFGVTKVGRMTKIDNLVQIGHNVQIGEYSGIVSQVGISGSTHIGNGVMLWGQVGVAGHLNIGDGAQVLAQAGVPRDIEAKGVYLGSPAVDRREALRQFHLPKSVENLQKEVAALKVRIAELESGKK